MASATLPGTKARRKDPRGRTHDGANTGNKLLNRRPDMYYVAVSKDGEAIGQYEGMGYAIERYEEGGPRFSLRTVKIGEPIEYRGTVLMSIAQETKDWIDQYGDDGESGWAMADKLEDKILDKSGAQKDLMRGLHGGYVKVIHEVEPLRPMV